MQLRVPTSQFQRLSIFCHSCSVPHPHTDTLSFLFISFSLGVLGGEEGDTFQNKPEILSFFFKCSSISPRDKDFIKTKQYHYLTQQI